MTVLSLDFHKITCIVLWRSKKILRWDLNKAFTQQITVLKINVALVYLAEYISYLCRINLVCLRNESSAWWLWTFWNISSWTYIFQQNKYYIYSSKAGIANLCQHNATFHLLDVSKPPLAYPSFNAFIIIPFIFFSRNM